jgi:propionyl-CoA synthetase
MLYQQEFDQSIENAEEFWADKAKQLSCYKYPDDILSVDSKGIHHWFADGEMNTSYMCLDYHVENGRADQTALIYDSPVTGDKKTFTYAELRDEVALCAGMLKQLGVVKGDRVSSSPRELPPQDFTEPDVNVSAHPAQSALAYNNRQ